MLLPLHLLYIVTFYVANTCIHYYISSYFFSEFSCVFFSCYCLRISHSVFGVFVMPGVHFAGRAGRPASAHLRVPCVS